MIHGPLGPVRSVRSHTRRWETLEVGHLFGKFSFESAMNGVRRCPDGSCEKNSTWIQKTQEIHGISRKSMEIYGNLIINFWLWIARPAMWWSQRPIQTSPATFACCWAPWMQSSPSWMPRERLRCLDRNIEHTWTYNFLIKDAHEMRDIFLGDQLFGFTTRHAQGGGHHLLLVWCEIAPQCNLSWVHDVPNGPAEHCWAWLSGCIPECSREFHKNIIGIS